MWNVNFDIDDEAKCESFKREKKIKICIKMSSTINNYQRFAKQKIKGKKRDTFEKYFVMFTDTLAAVI